jgi:hypothetical protein
MGELNRTWAYNLQGNRENTPIITCHEIGLNHRICFTNLLSHGEAEPLSRKCCFYHIDLPGQSDGVRL